MSQATRLSKANADGQDNQATGQTSFLQRFFIDMLKDIYYAEHALLNGLEDMRKAATTEELQDAFDTHRKQTERHIQRLEKVFRQVGQEPEKKTCETIEGLLKEAKSIIEETAEDSLTRDAALIIAAQKIEHYEIATYGGLVQLAITMGLGRAADILDKTLREEEQTDSLLTDIAEAHINIDAEEEGNYRWDNANKNEKTKSANTEKATA